MCAIHENTGEFFERFRFFTQIFFLHPWPTPRFYAYIYLIIFLNKFLIKNIF